MLLRLNACARTLFLLLCLFGTVACASMEPALEGTEWRLVGWTLSSLRPDGLAIRAKFADGKIAGFSGVNSYGTSYTIDDDGQFSVGAIAGTKMAASGPAMRGEGAYLALLGQARSYKISAGQLTLFDAGGNPSLIFEQASP